MLRETDYAYAVAKVKAVENRLLTGAKYDRMIDAGTPEEALRVLSEAGWGGPGAALSDKQDVEALIDAEAGRVYDFITEILPDKEMFGVFRLKHDYHNIKVILKAGFNGDPETMPCAGNGTIPAESLKAMIRGDRTSEMPPAMREAVSKATAAFIASRDPHDIDITVDAALYRDMAREAAVRGNPIVPATLSYMADFANLLTYIRVRRLRRNESYFAEMFVEGGSLGLETMLKHFAEPLEDFMREFKRAPYWNVIESGLAAYAATGSLTTFERLADDFVMDSLRFAKYRAFGIEPVIAYFYAKETELKNVRIIMTGKANGLKAEMIRGRLRKPYV